MKATVHLGPKGGTQYRLWTSDDTFIVVGKYKAQPHMQPAELAKAASMEADRKQSAKNRSEDAQSWRDIMRGG